MLEILVSNKTSGPNIDAAAQLLRQPRLWVPDGDYPDHPDWVDMALTEIEEERKRSLVAWLNGRRAGVVVYQRDKQNPTRLEVKNLSIEPFGQGRRLADFMFRQVEVVGPEEYPGVTKIGGDAKATNQALISFAVHNGMSVTVVPSLESSFGNNGVPDVIFNKPLIAEQSQIF